MNKQSSDSQSPRRVSYTALKHQLKKRPRDAHKGHFGHALVVGGETGFGGAALMAAEACARTGAGLVSVATRPGNIAAIISRRPEIMAHGVDNSPELDTILHKASVLILGPGLGQTDWSSVLFEKTLNFQQSQQLPMVIDADALNLVSQMHNPPSGEQWIMTPHPGEAARLLGISTADIQQDRIAAALALQEKFAATCVLKGAGSLIAWSLNGRQHIAQCAEGNPGMATGGMGDVLSGVIGSLLAQHFSPVDAAVMGVCLHAHAADNLARTSGERGLLATDLIPEIKRLVNGIEGE